MKMQRGYTLIELLLYVVMVGTLLSAVTIFFSITTDARIKNQSITEVDEQGAFAMGRITRAVRGATAITVPAAAATGASLTITVPTASLSPTVFSVSGGVLTIKEGTAAAIALTNSEVSVTSFSVTNLTRSGTSGIVRVALTLSRVNNSGRNEYSYQETFTTSVGVRP